MRHLLIALPLALTAACGTVTAVDDSPGSLDESLSSSFGGQTAADEQPGFGDDELAKLADAPAAAADATSPRPDLADANHVRIAVAWGYLKPHPDATESVDWSGSIKVTNAAVRVVRPLRFEERDAIIRPRTDRALIEFTSHTRPHADGLLLDVVMAPELNPAGGAVTLTLTTPPYTGSLTLERGMRLSRIVPVGDAGEHVVAYHVIRPDGGGGCAEGLVRGEWEEKASVDGREMGSLKGAFTDADGQIKGTLRGIFGERKNGHQVWFAKVIDKDGKFIGVFAGRFADGKFGGLFLGRGHGIQGMVRGEYGDGGFMGRYSARCGEDPREGQQADSDETNVSMEEGSDA